MPEENIVYEELLVPVPPSDWDDKDIISWFAGLGRSLNALHHSLAALHRKVDNMPPVDLGPLEEAVATLTTNDEALTTAVQGATTELVSLKAEAEALETQIQNNEPVDPAKVASILSGVTSVGSHLETLATSLTTATTEAEAQPTASGSTGASGEEQPTASGSAGGSSEEQPTASGAAAGSGDAAAADAGQTQSYARNAEGLVYYTGQGDPSTFDTSVWIKSTEGAAPGPVALYTFVSDIPNGPPTGVSEGWAPYTGKVIPVVPAA